MNRGFAKRETGPRASYSLDRLVALREPDLSSFSEEEIKIVDDMIDRLLGRDGSDLSKATHRLDGWKLANAGETIPYFTVCLPTNPEPLTPNERLLGVALAKQIQPWG